LLFSFIPYVGPVLGYLFAVGIFQVNKNIVINHGQVIYPSVKEGLKGFKWFCPLLGLFAIQYFICLAGYICLILPGLYLTFTTQFSLFIYLEYYHLGCTPWESIKLSIHVIHNQFALMLGFTFCIYLVNLAGLMCLLFGVLVTLPFTSLAMLCAFRDMIGFCDANLVENV